MTGVDGLWTRLSTRLRQVVCGLHGHDALLHFEKSRMSLLCASCGHETPGWHIGSSALGGSSAAPMATPTRIEAPTPGRLVHMPERRVA
jgi:hypothetical protein